MESSIEKAVRIAGSQSALARAVGVSPQAVQQWVDSDHVPIGRVLIRVLSKPQFINSKL